MCITEIFIDSYPDGAEVEFHRVKLCQQGYPEDPCDLHVVKPQPVRYIQYGEPTSEFIISQLRTPPRSSGAAPTPMVEIIEERQPKSRTKRRPLSNVVMEALFPRTTRRRRSRSKSRERVVVINAPPSPPPSAPPPIYRDPRPYVPPPLSPRYERTTEEAYIVEVSPSRGRQRPIIHETSPRRRSTSIEFRYVSPRRNRSPSQRRRRQREEERERQEERAMRDRREARLVAEIAEERERRRREEFQALQDAAINARPVRTFPNPIPRLRSILRPVIEQRPRYADVIDDLGLSLRGERVIAEAIAERERAESRERLLRERLEAEEEDEAQKERLRRRFTVSEGSGRGRRHRVVYQDGTYRWAD
ncbi:hypothetical protein V490_05657 [Pseudogymnoascus sp. VKM F-3557]|nr:hypothetical protein V490_05657 [Pseudogymnoascus sp. VKM F-3557]